MRIVLCDDHILFMEALAAVLEGRGHEVVAQAPTPDEAVEAVAEHQPDVCVTDLHFPAGDGFDAMRRMIEAMPRTRVVVLSADSNAAEQLEAHKIGCAFLIKHEPMDSIVEGIERGAPSRKPHAARPARRPIRQTEPGRTPEAQLGAFLTGRERQVLALLVDGFDTIAIAREMGITYSTTRTHIQNIVTKLGVHSKVAAAAFAVKHGLVTLPPDPTRPTDPARR